VCGVTVAGVGATASKQGDDFFCENPKRDAIADSYSLTRITEVACEFNVKR